MLNLTTNYMAFFLPYSSTVKGSGSTPRVKQRTAITVTPKPRNQRVASLPRPQRQPTVLPKVRNTTASVSFTPVNPMNGTRQSNLQRQTMQKASLSRYAGTGAAKSMMNVQSKVAAAKAARLLRKK